jgi:hypothetical protein
MEILDAVPSFPNDQPFAPRKSEREGQLTSDFPRIGLIYGCPLLENGKPPYADFALLGTIHALQHRSSLFRVYATGLMFSWCRWYQVRGCMAGFL